MLEFDPLDFLSGPPTSSSQIQNAEPSLLASKPVETTDLEEVDPPHILDLPHISLKPPSTVLLIILQLFEWETQYNFSPNTQASRNDSFFSSRGISDEELRTCEKWLSLYCPKLANQNVLKDLGDLRSQFPREFLSYMTSIVSSPLEWVVGSTSKETALLREKIWKQASLRMAENCGRTAQPEIQRKIVFGDSRYNVILKEPSWTEDNLGLKTWGSSLALSERLIESYSANPGYLKKPILELGAGTGLVGMVCGLIDQYFDIPSAELSKIFLTDLPQIVSNLKDNIELNGLSSVCEAHVLDWTNPSSFDKAVGLKNTNVFNTLIFSDPIYSLDHVTLVVNMIRRYLSPSGQILLELPERPRYEHAREELWRKMQSEFKGLKLVEQVVEDGLDDYGAQKLVFKHWKCA